MTKRGKKYLSISKKIDKNKLYSLEEAISLVKQTNLFNFDSSIECAFRMNLDPNKSDQNIRGVIVLPHGIGKKVRIAAVVHNNDNKELALKSGADYAGEQELIDKISKDWFEFDVLISTPEMMPKLAKLGRILGPKGLMPNPKTDTVTNDIASTVKAIKSGRVEYRLDKTGNINLMIGKISFSEQQILENFKTLYERIIKFKSSIKNFNIKNLVICSTMSPSIKINPNL